MSSYTDVLNNKVVLGNLMSYNFWDGQNSQSTEDSNNVKTS